MVINAPKSKGIYSAFLIVATLLGFIADVIAITSVLLAIDFTHGNLKIFPTKINFTVYHVIGLWIIAAFTYFGFLGIYWEKKRITKGYYESFWEFLLFDLIASFKNPFLLLPIIILIALLFWIFSNSSAMLGILTAVLILGTASITAGILIFGDKIKTQHLTLKNWQNLNKKISLMFSRHKFQWITVHSLDDIATTWNVDTSHLHFVLSKYSMEHPDKVIYGFIYDKKSGELLNPDKVLISIKNIDQAIFKY